MTKRLDALLQPDEQVVYRDPHDGMPGVLWAAVLTGPLIAALLSVRYFPLGDPLIVAIAEVIVFGSMVLIAFLMLRASAAAGDVLVTDRRMLWRGGARGPDRAVAIPLNEITSVTLVGAAGGLTVRVVRRDGATCNVHGLRRAQPFATALAARCALPRPPLVGRLEHLTLACLFLGGLPFAFHLKVLAEDLHLMPVPAAHGHELALIMAADQVPLLLGFWLGSHLAALIAFAIMPWLISAEQAQAWLRLKPESRRWQILGRCFGWKGWVHAHLVAWLYRAPFPVRRTPNPA